MKQLAITSLVVLISSSACDEPDISEQTVALGDRGAFLVRAYRGDVVKNGGKCLDYASETAGEPVVLNDCAVAHSIVVTELPERAAHDVAGLVRKHEIRLRAGNKVLGLRNHGVGAQGALELQDELADPPHGRDLADDQTFAFDGDSIIVAADREGQTTFARVRVVKVESGRGANGSPIVVGSRELDDSELWAFEATDGTGRDPTTGFVHVSGLDELATYLGPGAPPPDFDTVFVVGSGPILLSAPATPLGEPTTPIAAVTAANLPLTVSDGVTVRGDRRGFYLGPELAIADVPNGTLLFDVTGTHTRITGLRVRGPSRSQDGDLPNADGISVYTEHITAIDHNDISAFPHAAIEVIGPDGFFGGDQCPVPRPSSDVVDTVRIADNFIHHNQKREKGYGIVMDNGGNAQIIGNTFVDNRHAIASDGSAFSGYRAWFNLVLTSVPVYYLFWESHDFDVHGTRDDSIGGGVGGWAGHRVDIGWNTFFGDNRKLFRLRGAPCTTTWAPDTFHNNITEQDKDDAFGWNDGEISYSVDFEGSHEESGPTLFQIRDNRYAASDSTQRLAVGDFDGDGTEDLFLATGTAWFYSAGGAAAWRLLSGGRTDSRDSLLFGDFDNDGRTDVIGKNGVNVMVSWGGVSPWERLNQTNGQITDLAVGNFDGVGGDDLFYADGSSWWLSAGGSADWVRSGPSSFRVRDLLIGDFNGNGTSDVFGVVGGWWSYSDGTTVNWAQLHPAPSGTVAGLFVGNFNGDTVDDIATVRLGSFDPLLHMYLYSPGGTTNWQPLLTTYETVAAIGRFTSATADAMLAWEDRKLRLAFAGTDFADHSTQDMH